MAIHNTEKGDEMVSGSALDGRIAVVTGAAAGIGRATARLFSAEGARVVVADIDGDGARRVADEVSGTAVAVDVADEGEVRSLFEACEAAFGRLDVLVNNAAYVPTRARAARWTWMTGTGCSQSTCAASSCASSTPCHCWSSGAARS